MQRQESTVATALVPGRAPGRGLPGLRNVLAVISVAIVAALVAVVASAERDAWLATHPAVPNLVGMTVERAARLMIPLHFGLSVNRSAQHPSAPTGIILSQNPAPDRRLAIGSIVQVTVSQGSGVVPRLRGEPVAVAARELEAVGLRLGKVSAIEDSAPADTVLEQFTPPGRRLDPNSAVDVLVSRLPDAGPAEPPPLSPSAAPSPLGAPGSPAGPLLPIPYPNASGSGASAPLPPGSPARSAPRVAVPAAAPAPEVVTPTPVREEGSARAGASSGQCSSHAERERLEVCHEPESDGGAQPDVHGPEHRSVPAGP